MTAEEKALSRIAELEAENATLLADKERLDWVEGGGVESLDHLTDERWEASIWRGLDREYHQAPTLRSAIDAAREGE